jgi:divalent metal cation (Fe/Co/Zn/Cd) transporter
MNESSAAAQRVPLLQHALRLEYLTVGWNVVEGLVAVSAAALAGSIALLGFGIDSFVECASGLVLVWRLTAERRGMDVEEIERLDQRAHKLVGASLFLLAAYIGVVAGLALWHVERPRPSIVGIVLTVLSIATMLWLARAKRRAAAALQSRALEADAFQTTACFWLSIITLAGIGLNALFGWWWADPLAALGMTWFIAREGLEAWRGEDCGCAPAAEVERCSAPGNRCGCPGERDAPLDHDRP